MSALDPIVPNRIFLKLIKFRGIKERWVGRREGVEMEKERARGREGKKETETNRDREIKRQIETEKVTQR